MSARRAVSNRELELNESSGVNAVAHMVAKRKQKELDDNIEKIRLHLVDNPQKVEKALEVVVNSNVCLPNDEVEEEEAQKLKVKKAFFTDNYKKLERVPADHLCEVWFPRVSSLTTEFLNTLSIWEVRKLFFYACGEEEKHDFGPKERDQWDKLYEERARKYGDLLTDVIIEDGSISWNGFGLYTFQGIVSADSAENEARFTHICFAKQLRAPLGVMGALIKPDVVIADNWSVSMATILLDDSPPIECRSFFAKNEEFLAMTAPTVIVQKNKGGRPATGKGSVQKGKSSGGAAKESGHGKKLKPRMSPKKRAREEPSTPASTSASDRVGDDEESSPMAPPSAPPPRRGMPKAKPSGA
mmetsp:Transcript_7444/g.16440  ORF Transcript_7444/g.16440 Transcript_7444/m.16440 type:complete len:357 (+) Transcript_7444:87-1157(+)|eukprot:CAMPEP_0178400552 /NCGR_PEP_ID=MMETSP0689_2-20121128/15848_1 /TAXON_ID=160604 /ORGANISM="Amphidinium massartii, Strain CS-259" /LENGTH=356 /DNA_ID=CAMNT_0020021351 /DNA_START=83 /DNA_END=1153 /DNA_ORIENTATION=-